MNMKDESQKLKKLKQIRRQVIVRETAKVMGRGALLYMGYAITLPVAAFLAGIIVKACIYTFMTAFNLF